MKTVLAYERKDGFCLKGIGATSGVELYFGRDTGYAFALNYRACVALLTFLLRWLVFSAVFGLKQRWLNRKLERALNRRTQHGTA